MSFIKQHKLLSIIFFICLLAVIKFSTIPYPFTPANYISFVFNAPQSEPFISIAEMLNVFATAYLTSLLFYILVSYLPEQRMKASAKVIYTPKLKSLYLYISELLAMLEYSAKNDGLTISEDENAMDKLQFTNDVVYCKRASLKNDIENGIAVHEYRLLIDCDKYKRLILDSCTAIACTPSFGYCDEVLIHIISKIQLSKIWEKIPDPNNPTLKLNHIITHIELGKSYLTLQLIYTELGKFVDERLDSKMSEITKEEVDKHLRENAELLQQHPEVLALLRAIHSQPQT